ncbi:MAG: response regulator [Muribaculaceae bacterium]|nr:response regulator [Muribaculaceae bacterium]
MTKKLFTILTILLLTTSWAVAQNYPYRYYFHHLSSQNGLSQNDVKAILQDSHGFMWLGTKNKLNRYDGTSVKTIECRDAKTGFCNNNISSLYEDADHMLWVGTDKGVFLYDPAAEVFTHLEIKTSRGVAMTDWVAQIDHDNDGNVWIIVPNQGIFKYDPKKKDLKQYSTAKTGHPDDGTPQCFVVDKNGRLWVGTDGNGIFAYNRNRDIFEQYLGQGDALAGENSYRMADYNEFLVVGVHEGRLRKFNKHSGEVTDVNAPDVHYKIIRDVRCYDDVLWVGTDNGVYIVDELKGTCQNISNDAMCDYTLNDNQTNRIYRDAEEGIWVSTNHSGVNYMPQQGIHFLRYVPLTAPNTINSKRIREIVEDNSGNIWVGTDNHGVNIFNPTTGIFTQPNVSSNKPLAMINNAGSIWMGFFKNGIDIASSISGTSTHLTSEMMGLNDNSIYALCLDSKGRMWVGDGWGVYVGEPGSNSYVRQEQFGLNYTYDIFEDRNHNMWVATMGNGVYCYNSTSGKTTHFTHNDKDSTSLSSNSVSNIMQAADGTLWFSTDRGGICAYNTKTGKFRTYSVAQGLPDDTSYKILEDKDGNLWFGTNNGLVKFSPKTGKCKTYTTHNGLPCNQFNYKSALHASTDIFYFGSNEGLISFDPYFTKINEHVPQVYITSIYVDNKELCVNAEDSPLKQNIAFTDKIVLSSDQSNLGFSFAALSYVNPEANVIAYKMDGVDNDWIETTETHSVTYANLSPGTYTLRVKGCNNDGVWNEQESVLHITIRNPWWNTIWAWMVYLAIIAGMAWLGLKRMKQLNARKTQEAQHNFENEKEKELYRTKIDFFTSIAHEIRTPVTLINGPLENLMEMDIVDPEIKRNLATMSRNTNELMTLINQLLDFRKVDSNKMEINTVSINIASMLREWTRKFAEAAQDQGRELTLTGAEDKEYVLADRNSVIKILNNLFSNALKYSKTFIKVSLEHDDEKTFVTVINDGKTIPDNEQSKIFEAFFQASSNAGANASSGIGLYLARNIAELNGGTLTYDVINGLNTFVLTLKTLKRTTAEAISNNDMIVNDEPEEDNSEQRSETILVVDDNVELLSFISEKLGQYYNVKTASNGVKALEVISQESVDVVVSDIMMPEMDGIELCKHIKGNIETSHIPVILLTAKNDLDSKVEGLRIGADAYIEKPFSFKYLVAQLTSIFDNKRRETEAFNRKPFVPTGNMGMSKADEKLLNKIVEVVEENIENPNFGVEMLAEQVFMSRSSLHRKIKAISGSSPTDFIRLIRLKKASALIAEGSYRTGEVCYIVGINSPSYFIKLFQKQFGMTPKEFEKQQRAAQAAASQKQINDK